MLALALGCQNQEDAKDKAKADQNGSASARVARPIAVSQVRRGRIQDVLRLHAEIHPWERTQLSSPMGGSVEGVFVDAGDKVRAGQVLARIGSVAAAAREKEADANYEAAHASMERLNKLADKDLATGEVIEVAKARLAQAESARILARVALDQAILDAPHKGVVSSRHISRGEVASPGQPALVLLDIHKVKLVAQLPEADVAKVEVGAPVRVQADALGDADFAGTVSRVGAEGGRYSRTFDLEIEVDNPSARLKPGMLARIEVVRQVLENVPVVRRDAVVESERGPGVFVVEGDKARRVAVRLGAREGNNVAILAGLKGGESVVVAGQRFIADGESVRVISKTADGSSATSQGAQQGAGAQP